MKIRVLNGGVVYINPETGAWTVMEDGDIWPVEFESAEDVPEGIGPWEPADAKAKPPAETSPVVADPFIAQPKKAKKPKKAEDDDPVPTEVE